VAPTALAMGQTLVTKCGRTPYVQALHEPAGPDSVALCKGTKAARYMTPATQEALRRLSGALLVFRRLQR
jgi:hypothetical protein